jgi:biopolymer transport protein ExbD
MKRRETLSPDLTPVIDIVFILLIFFIVSSTFKKKELAFELNLPNSKEASMQIDKKEIVILLNKNKIALKEKEVTWQILENNLKNIKDKTRSVIVKIDKDVKYQRIVILFDLLKKYNLSHLALENKVK